MDFNHYNDKELIYLIKDGSNPRALELFVNKYRILSLKLIRKTMIKGYEEDDLLSEANEILMKCINKYSNNGSFYTYFSISLKRHLYKLKYHEQDDMLRLSEDIADERIYEAQYIDEIRIKQIYKRSSNLQKQIEALILKGSSISEISKKLEITPYKIYYEMRKLKSEDKKQDNSK